MLLLGGDDVSDNSRDDHDTRSDLVDDRNHGGFGWHFLGLECKRGFASPANINRFAGSCADGVDRNDGGTIGQPPDQQKRSATQRLVLDGANNTADDFAKYIFANG